MNIAELRNHLKIMNEDEVFYKKCYLKNLGLTKHDYIDKLDLENIVGINKILKSESSEKVFFLPDEFTDESQFKPDIYSNIILSKHNRYTPRFRHKHTFFELIYVLSGHCQQEINDIVINLNKGDLCCVPPNMYHCLSVFNNSVIITILIKKQYFNEILFNFSSDDNVLSRFFMNSLYNKNFNHYLTFHTKNDTYIETLILGLFLEYMEQERFSAQILNNQLAVLFANLLRKYESTAEYPIFSKNNEKLSFEIITYIQNNYSDVSIRDVAEHMNYTVPYLSKLIKKTTGYTFSEILKRTRLQKAEVFLTNTIYTISEISETLGYMNTETFIRAFTSYYHISPKAYRLKHIS